MARPRGFTNHDPTMPTERPTARAFLTDEQWKMIKPLLPGKRTDAGRTGRDNRMALEGMIWVLRTGAPWRDLPARFGPWHTIYQRFRRWSVKGVFDRIFDEIGERDVRTVMIDGSYTKVHQHGTGALRNGRSPAASAAAQKIGKTQGGWTTKLMAVVDATGRVVRIRLSPGNVNEGQLMMETIRDIPTSEVIADKAYDSNANRNFLAAMGIEANIPSTRSRNVPILHDAERYKARHLVENLFVDLKQFRGISTRYAKTGTSYAASINLASWLIESKETRRSAKLSEYTKDDAEPRFDAQIPMDMGVEWRGCFDQGGGNRIISS